VRVLCLGDLPGSAARGSLKCVIPRCVLALLAAALLGACGKETATSAPGSNGANTPELAAALSEMTHAARRYAAEKQKVPATPEELVAAGYLTKLPELPGGKKIVIDPKRLEPRIESK
jgi:hypothetical protein